MKAITASTWQVVALLSLVGAGVQAQTPYPDRPIMLIVPFPPGGVADTVAWPTRWPGRLQRPWRVSSNSR